MSSLLNRRTFLSGAAASLAAAAQPKRNVLFIASDDLNDCLGCFGHPIVRTPNLDRLATLGVYFPNAYCQFPLCSPSRSSLMTGLAPDTTKIYDLQTHFRTTLPDVVTLPQLFQKNGYFVARAGKIYHYGVPAQIGTNGLDDAASWNHVVNPAGVDHTKEEPLLINHTPGRGLGSAICYHVSDAPDEQHTDGMVAASVAEMIEQHRDQPWFLGAGFYRPHVPWIAPAKYFDLYPLDRIQAPPFDESEMHQAPEWAYFTKPANWGMTLLQRREAIRAYYASISFMDAQVGKLLDTLDRLKLTRNTTFVFWGDNGYHLGEHGQWMKQTVFEPAARVPMIMAGAGVPARGRGCTRPVELLDMYPTLAAICNLGGTPGNLHGRSLLPLLTNPAAAWDKPAISQVRRPSPKGQVMGYSLRTARYRYSTWEQGGAGEELYDYESDPREIRNLAADPAAGGLKQQLRTQLLTIARQRGMPPNSGSSN
ncbi:MAG: sulfatase [Acidobacteriota bacterium]|nr:sulfatase [Acidobacteriota bacterium]